MVSVSNYISNYHDKIRLVPRTLHPFLEPAEALMLGRARHASGLDAEGSASDSDSDADSDSESDARSSEDESDGEDGDKDEDDSEEAEAKAAR